MSSRRASLFILALFLVIGSFFADGNRLGAVGPTLSPASLTTLGVPVTQNFNTLAVAGTTSVVPTGWGFDESGTSSWANGLYWAGTGSVNTGDIYSFGTSGSAERALGGLRSGTLTPIIGAAFTNNSGATVTSLDIAYTGEQWRLGTSGRTDRLDFQYSTSATSLTTGTWADVNTLDFPGPISVGTVGLLNGNAAANRAAISGTISGLTIPNGATVFIRWTDFDASGADDGLAVDDFSITPRATSSPTGIGSADPSSVDPGGTTVLKVTVTPGVGPASTGLSVTADLAAIGGPATQPFFDDGTNGDVTAGDAIFSYQATVAAGTTAGAKALMAVVADAQARSTNAIISLTVLAPFRAIHDIQGSGTLSPYAGQQVKTSGIVTGIKAGSAGGFFIQVPDADADGLPATSEGIFVFTGSSVPAAAAAGNAVAVTGVIQEFVSSSDPWSQPATEIAGGPVVTLLSSGNPLPAPVTLTAADTNPAGALEQLERFEGMRVHVESLTVVAPTEGNVTESSAMATSDGVFFGVITGVARPFREPGIPLPDPLPAGAPCCVPRFDANPELIRVDSDGQPGGTIIDVTSGATVTGLTGPLDYSSRAYTILPDPATPPSFSGNVSATPVPAPSAGQFTIASFNMGRFYDTTNDPGISDVALTTAAFNNRLNKASLAIRTVMRTPDIIGVQEVENLTTLQAIANKINADAVSAGEPDPQYDAHLAEGNDVGGIDVGFLVKRARVSVIDVTQEGAATTYIDPNTGLPAMLNDRPPLVLRAEIQPPSGSAFPITVIGNHLRSLSGVDDAADGNRVRTKRAAQAEFLANLIQARQAANPDERIISIGDYNAFQFNDGYADVVGTVRGAPAPATEVVKASIDLVNPDLLDLVERAPAAQRYSYVFGGSAQELDHLLITGNLLSRFTALTYARNGADFPETYRNDPDRPERISDHDMPVAYFTFPAADLSVAKSAAVSPVLTGSLLSYTITVENTLTDAANSVVISDQVPAGTSFVSMTGPSGWICGVPTLGGTLTCSTASLAAGGTATLTLTVKVACGLADATPITNTASVTSTTYDPDGSNNTSTSAITASNPAPIVVAPADATYQCVSEVPVASAASASVSDNCGVPAVSLTESSNGGAGSPASPLVIARTFSAVDSAGGIGSATQTITVIDNTPPVIRGLSVDRLDLRPPNHKMQLVTLSYVASDGCSAPVVVVSVSSNEPVNGTGDGDTAPDWQVLDSTHVLLRAERAGQGVGRVYTIHVTATDAAGNMTVADVRVSVPHNR